MTFKNQNMFNYSQLSRLFDSPHNRHNSYNLHIFKIFVYIESGGLNCYSIDLLFRIIIQINKFGKS